MSSPVLSGAIALFLGAVVAVVLFVPFVARVYRVRGHLTLLNVLTGIAAAVYFFAIWTYTLLPLPNGPIEYCVGVNLDPTAALDDIAKALAADGNPLLHPGILQLALNVALFVPLGIFIRIFTGRGVVVSTIVGLGVSLLIEVTQATGVYGLYECAYRLGDVNDLMTNTAGALLGGVVALAVPKRWLLGEKTPEADLPRPVTRSRRILAMACDALALQLLGVVIVVGVQTVRQLLSPGVVVANSTFVDTLGIVVPVAVWFAVIMVTGRSVGDLVVRLEYVGGTMPDSLARFLRFVGGIAGIVAVSWLPFTGGLAAFVLTALAVILTLTTESGRGLPGVLTGRQLADSRA